MYARHVRESWMQAITRAIELGDANAAYKLTVAYVRRLRDVLPNSF